MNRSFTAAGIMLGIAIGLPAGFALSSARRAWSDFTKTKALLPSLKTTAWESTRSSATRFVFVALLVGAAVGYAAFGR
jgi:hypothetical protein